MAVLIIVLILYQQNTSMTVLFDSVLKFNTVFVTDARQNRLVDIGFGARSIKTSVTSNELVLSDDEAFYLLYNNYLKITDKTTGDFVTVDKLWEVLLKKHNDFPAKYKVYSFFREKSFVVKSGLHYGVDFTVYRSTPIYCHSELCATVVDGSSLEGLNWRHLSTLTRVIPDVMKIALLCFVMPAPRDVVDWTSEPEIVSASLEVASPAPVVHRSKYLDLLFPGGKPPVAVASSSTQKNHLDLLDCSSHRCLEQLVVHPVTLLVRRLPAKSETYRSIGKIHAKYRSMSILKAPRLSGPATKTKKRRKRRDHTAVRVKLQSKSNLLWKSLLKEPVEADKDTSKDPRSKFGNNKKKDKNNRNTADNRPTDKGVGHGQKRKLDETVAVSDGPVSVNTESVTNSSSNVEDNFSLESLFTHTSEPIVVVE